MRVLIFRLSIVLLSLVCLCFSCNIEPSNRARASYGTNATPGGGDKPPMKPGTCYAKCLISDEIGIDTIGYLPVYTGAPDPNIAVEQIVLREAVNTTRWEKIKSENCRSRNEDDCLIWCLKEVKLDEISMNVVLDTTATKDYKMTYVEQEYVSEVGGYSEWREVVCQQNLDNGQIEKAVISGLLNRGYLDANHVLKMGRFKLDAKCKAALIKFQKDNSLPVGQLDFETLDLLEVNY